VVLTVVCEACAEGGTDQVIGTVDDDRVWRAAGLDFVESIDEEPDGPTAMAARGHGHAVAGVCPGCDRPVRLPKKLLDKRVREEVAMWSISPDQWPPGVA